MTAGSGLPRVKLKETKMPLDKTQLQTAMTALLGEEIMGVAEGEAVTMPNAPMFRTFTLARLGDLASSAHLTWRWSPERSAAFAGLLREIADGLSPLPPPLETSPRLKAVATAARAFLDASQHGHGSVPSRLAENALRAALEAVGT